ncbi:hypothetical protein [Salinicola acroporae]|nr:hypothetical protein [Salinicola acroporae]
MVQVKKAHALSHSLDARSRSDAKVTRYLINDRSFDPKRPAPMR